MSLLSNINWITVLIAGVFIIPILSGIFSPFSSDRIRNSLSSLINSLRFILSTILSIYLTGVMLSHNQNIFLTGLCKIIPSIQKYVSEKNIWVYIVFLLVFIFAVNGILRFLTIPIYRHVIVPVSNKLSSAVSAMNGVLKRIIGGIWQIPKSVCLVLVLSILLSLYPSFNINASLSEYINQSSIYQLVNQSVISPLLSSGIAKQIPVILNDSFRQAAKSLPEEARKTLVIEYFNGITLDQAIISNTEIDTAAKKIVGTKSSDKDKAYLIYQWISKNIKYDDNKAIAVASDSTQVSSGAIVVFKTRSGVCFDYACLFVAMCRAVGVKVRFITGLGYGGSVWGDHAWNQVYDTAGNRWINVDSTFGSSGINYFDKANFDSDHADAVIQGEW